MWKKGLYINQGTTSNVLVELWGMLYGLDLAWKEGYKKVILESDSLTRINLV